MFSINTSIKLGLGLLCLLLSSCYRIKISNGQSLASHSIQARYYHQAVFEAVPLSDAVDLRGACPMEDWHSVTMQKTPLNVIMSVPTGFLYSQWTVQPQCESY
jgi:hypothetical protein